MTSASNVLITGTSGFIGGSLLADLLARADGPIKNAKIFAATRSDEQVKSVSKLGINVLQVDLTDEKSVLDAIVKNEVDIVIHTAGAILPQMAINLIKALGERRRVNLGRDHVFRRRGWPYGQVKDSDDSIIEKQKEIGESNPVRKTNVIVAELGKAQGVTTYNVPVPTVYGRGTGEWRKLSVNIPAVTRASMKLKTVYKFEKDGVEPPAIHISDLTALYGAILEKILLKEAIPSNDKGYYFAVAHKSPWWEVMERLAQSMHARGLVSEPTAKVWPSWEMAAEHTGFPLVFIKAIGTSSGDLVAVNGPKLGWQPKWDEKMYLDSIDDEVQAVLDLDTVKMTLWDSL
uniref:NAD-dependent epimerase/dehydratase domain-containing protein n=1 Tax=Bionectria ochroleuca TaxID=29856 RepID=A0A8H7KD34_BIOOC